MTKSFKEAPPEEGGDGTLLGERTYFVKHLVVFRLTWTVVETNDFSTKRERVTLVDW